MSTKTLRKRIALVAVAALGAGVLSVAPANAAGTDGLLKSVNASSVGVLTSDLSGTTTQTATLLSTGTLVLDVDAGATTAAVRVDVSAGGVITGQSSTGANADVAVIKADQTSATERLDNNETDYTVTIRPTGAIGSTFTVKGYATATGTTVVSVLTVTIAGSSVAGVVSPADSYVAWTSDNTPATTDAAGKSTATTTNALFLSIQLNDAYGADITSATGALTAVATAGANVVLGAGTLASNGTFSTAVSGTNPSQLYARVSESTAGAGWAGTVTITYNGTVVATKSGTITGAPATIAVTPKKVGKNNGSATTDAFEYTVSDRAGNKLAFTSAGLVLSKSSAETVVSGAVGNSTDATTTTAGKGNITCVSSAVGTSDVTMQITLSNGTVVKSNTVKFTCGGAAVTYSASFDKASYVQGEIAKLTVAFKDAKGGIANSVDAVTTITSSKTDASFSVPMMAAVAAAATAAEYADVNGNIVYTYTVGSTSGVTNGKYNAVVSFPTLNTLGANQTVTYSISTGTTGVTNEDVLKAIVSLIASINKQIAALQKALLRR
jgi:hypothetical protein